MARVVAAVIGLAIIVFILFKLFGRRGPNPNSRELAMAVWAAFGPYSSVEEAEASLCRSVRAVFGVENFHEHAAWIQGHTENFRRWEAAGTLDKSLEFMRRGLTVWAVGPDFQGACTKFKEEAKTEALRLLEKITQDFGIIDQAPAMRALIDGTKTNEEIHDELQAGQQELAARIVKNTGDTLLSDSSEAAASLIRFLQDVSREHKGEEATTPEAIGMLYLNCINYAGDNLASEFTKVFHSLDDAWKLAKSKGETDG